MTMIGFIFLTHFLQKHFQTVTYDFILTFKQHNHECFIRAQLLIQWSILFLLRFV